MAFPEHPEPHVVLPSGHHENTLILLHGTSQTGSSFASPFLSFPFPSPLPQSPPPTTLSPQNPFPSSYPNAPPPTPQTTLPTLLPTTKLIFPTGSPKPTTVFGGEITNAWFDIHTFTDRTIGETDSIVGLRQSILYLTDLIKQEVELLPVGGKKGRVVIGGFSQGAAMTMLLLLSGELDRLGLTPSIAGFIGMSGWLPFRSQISAVLSSLAEDTGVEKQRKVVEYVRGLLGLEPLDTDLRALEASIWLAHGEEDKKAKFEWGVQMRDVLVGTGVDVRWGSYAGLEHWWGEEEMGDLGGFLVGLLSREEKEKVDGVER